MEAGDAMKTFSGRQYAMLQTLASGQTLYLSIKEAQAFDQRPFRSMLIRKWIAYKAGRGFYATKEGREAWHNFHQTDIARKNPTLPLTAYFDPTAYGLDKKLAIVKRGAA